MAERQVALPRVGTITARDTFRILASMNPYDNVGTARISASVYDRWCRLALGYQTAEEEAAIVAVRTGSTDTRLIADAVALTRATRAHPDLRRGASVRGAIDLVAIAEALDHGDNHQDRRVLDAAHLALSARVALDETTDATPETIITQLWERLRDAAPTKGT
jgi:MoxR-like ATPase